MGCNEHPFNDAVGISLKNRSVHEGSWVSLVCIADQILDASRGSLHKIPLQPCWETCPSPSPEARFLDFLNDLIGLHRRKGLRESGITVTNDVLFNALGINLSTILENILGLPSVEGNLRGMGNSLACERMRISQALNHSASHECLRDDLWNIVRKELLIKNVLWLNGNDRCPGTETLAPCVPDFHAVF
jgi:hypothetical protein